jgi:beta-lactamase class A
MLAVSSNSAGHALLRRLGRPEFNAAMTALGLRDTRVPLSSGDDEAAVTSAADMAQLLRRLVREELLTDDSRRELADLLALREPLDPLPDAVPDGTPVYSKVGTLEAASNVAGVIITPSGPLIVSIFDRNVDPGIARAITADLVEAVLEVYGEQ